MSLSRFTFTDRARPIAQLGIGEVRNSSTAAWDSARWNNAAARWGGNDPSWRDVSCEQFSFEMIAGRRAATDRFEVATGTLYARNVSGWADPHHFDAPTGTTVRPGQQMRVGVDHATLGRVWLFHGYIDAITPRYEPGEPDTVQFDLIDALGEVNRAKVASGSTLAASETVHYRIARLLDHAGWPITRRHLDNTTFTVIASAINGQIADLVSQAADSAGGAVFGRNDGWVVFRRQDWQTYLAGTPPDGIIGNVDPGDLCPQGWVRPFARADITTRAIFGRDPATARTHDDPAGIATYGIEPFERTDLLTSTDAELDQIAARVMQTRAAATAPRVRGVTIDARHGDAYVDLLTSLDLFKPSRYRCRLELERGLVFDADHFATGVHHRLDAHGWAADINLDVAAPYLANPGHWDGATWDNAVWSDVAAVLAEARALLDREPAP